MLECKRRIIYIFIYFLLAHTSQGMCVCVSSLHRSGKYTNAEITKSSFEFQLRWQHFQVCNNILGECGVLLILRPHQTSSLGECVYCVASYRSLVRVCACEFTTFDYSVVRNKYGEINFNYSAEITASPHSIKDGENR